MVAVTAYIHYKIGLSLLATL